MKELNPFKLNQDSYYRELKYILRDETICNAGYFENTLPDNKKIDHNLEFICTPIPKFEVNSNPCIILSTGSFNPIHLGHIDMFNTAKIELEEKGYNVIQGYISPSHDEYVLSKSDDGLNINTRIDLINQKIKNIDWLSLCPWEALFNSVAINFTDVIERLKAYYKKYTNIDIPVFFLCGSDNASFSLTFWLKGNCIVIQRPGYEEKFERYANLFLNRNDVIFSNQVVNSSSSTELRKENIAQKVYPDVLNLRVSSFDERNKIIDTFELYFKNVNVDNTCQQHVDFCRICPNYDEVISLDPLLRGQYNLGISRLYEVFGCKFVNHIERPNHSKFSLQEQIDVIPKNESYILFDDDICSGETIKFAMKLLNDNDVSVKEVKSLNGLSLSPKGEVLDLRDFFIDDPVNENGLVIRLPFTHELIRVPYIYPFVNPSVRASVFDSLKFSIKIWEINYEYYEYYLNTRSTLAQMKNNTQKLFEFLGFKPSDKMSNICKFFIDKLKAI